MNLFGERAKPRIEILRVQQHEIIPERKVGEVAIRFDMLRAYTSMPSQKAIEASIKDTTHNLHTFKEPGEYFAAVSLHDQDVQRALFSLALSDGTVHIPRSPEAA